MALQFPEVDDDLVEKIVDKLKSQGIFDQFRKDCLADVDSRPAYQNLRDKVNRAVANFLSRQPWKDDLNKNQVRECLRKHVHQGYLEAGVNRIVEQVVKPKIYSVFTPKVEDVVYEVMGIERPANAEDRSHSRLRYLMSSIPHEKSLSDLLPTDLDPVSPGSINESGNESANLNDSFTSKIIDDGDNVSRDVNREFNIDVNEASNDSKVSGISELSSHGSTTKLDISESAHLPGDKSEICNSNDGVNSRNVGDKDKSKGAIDSVPGSFDFDNFSNLKEKLMKTDPLNKNTCLVKNSESETHGDLEKSSDESKKLKEDSHCFINTEDKSIVKSPVPFIYSEDSIGSNSQRIRIENESTRNSLIMDCDDTSSVFLDKKSNVKEIESVSCIESLKEESQISIASNDSRKFSNFSNLKSINDNSVGRSEGSSPDMKDDKEKDVNREKKIERSDKPDKYDSKFRSRDSSRDRKYSKDDKKYHSYKDRSKYDKDKHSNSSKRESSSRDKYSSRSRDDKYRSSSRHGDKKSDGSKRDSRSTNYDDKSRRDKDLKQGSDDKPGKKDDSKVNSDNKASGSKDNRYNDKKISKRDDSKRSSDKSSRPKDDNRSSGSKDSNRSSSVRDKTSKNYSDDDKYLKRDSKNSRISDNKDSKVSDQKTVIKTKDEPKRDNKDAKSGSEQDDCKNSKKETKDHDKVSSISTKGDNKHTSEKESKKNLNSNEAGSKKDDKDSKKRKREGCSEDTPKKENRRSRDRDDGGHKNSGNSTMKDQKGENDKKKGSNNKQDKMSSKGSKQPSDSHDFEVDQVHDKDEYSEVNNSCDLYLSENSVCKRPKINNESNSNSSPNSCMDSMRERGVCVTGSDLDVSQSANLQPGVNSVKLSNVVNLRCKQEPNSISESNSQVSQSENPSDIRHDVSNINYDESNDTILFEKSISSQVLPTENENGIICQHAEQSQENNFMDKSESSDFYGFDEVCLSKSFKVVFNFEQFMKITYGSDSLGGVKCSDRCFSLTDNNLNNIDIKAHDYPSLLKECSNDVTGMGNSLIISNCSFENSFSLGNHSTVNKSINSFDKSIDSVNNSLTLNSLACCESGSNSGEKFKGIEKRIQIQENTVSSLSNEKRLENEDVVSLTESSSSDRCFTLPSVTEDMLDSFMMKNIGNEDDFYNSSDSEVCATSSPTGTQCSSQSPQNHDDSVHQESALLCPKEVEGDKHLKSEMQLLNNQEDNISIREKDVPGQEDKKTPSRTSQRYDSSDLYKPRPLITNSSRRNRVTNKEDSDLAQGTKRSAEAMEFSENKRPR